MNLSKAACYFFSTWIPLLVLSQDPETRPIPVSFIGMEAEISQWVIPGTEVRVKAMADREVPVVVRVAATYPHGSDHRYDLVYYGLEEGQFNLSDFMERLDDRDDSSIPPIMVKISSSLPAGQVEPSSLDHTVLPARGSYRKQLILIVLAWAGVLLGILFSGRFGKQSAAVATEPTTTLAERLQPIVERAMLGQLSKDEQAALERMLFTWWQRKLNLQEMEPVSALRVLREHEEAGPIFRALEDWLHKPGGSVDADIHSLLAPYRYLSPDEMKLDEVS
ncbi:MAG: hypothetical protein P8L18_01650 [Verrucomicrobiota bacterium]|nr:hypothetical protein [Verrucomicrobiota bacterium]